MGACLTMASCGGVVSMERMTMINVGPGKPGGYRGAGRLARAMRGLLSRQFTEVIHHVPHLVFRQNVAQRLHGRPWYSISDE